MRRMRRYVVDRHRHNWILLAKFSIVGGSGFFVNMAVFWVCTIVGPDARSIAVNLPATDYNIRAYHVYSTLAFIIANASNYLLNRAWTFASRGRSDWRTEYVPFLLIGVVSQAIGLLLLTVLLHADSPLRLDSVLLAQGITIVLVTPISFVGNKLWTFRAVRDVHRSTGYRTTGQP